MIAKDLVLVAVPRTFVITADEAPDSEKIPERNAKIEI